MVLKCLEAQNFLNIIDKDSHFGRGHHIKCVYPDCPSIFKTWNSLYTQLSRSHSNALKHLLSTNLHFPARYVALGKLELCMIILHT